MSQTGPHGQTAPRSARERLLPLLDADSFIETGGAGGAGGARSTCTGHGTIEGRIVCVYATGSPTAADTDRITRLVELAARTGCPVIGMDTGASREPRGETDAPSDGVARVAAVGRLHRAMTMVSGVIPQVALLTGPTVGASAVTPVLADFLVLGGPSAGLQLPSTDAIETAGSSFDDRVHAEGAHHVADNEESACAWVRTLIGLLPSNNLTDPPTVEPGDDGAGEDLEQLPEQLIAEDAHGPYDVQQVIAAVLDGGDFCEVHPHRAPNLVCGLGRLGGRTVGMVANQRDHLGGVIDHRAATKATRFIRTCDAFNIPVITLLDSPGFLAEQGYEAVRGAAALVHAYAEASIPLLTVIIGTAYGATYEAMGSAAVGADLVLAWPTASVGAAPPQETVNHRHHQELASADDRESLRAQLITTVRREQTDLRRLGDLGLLDAVVSPHRTRRELIRSLRLLQSKRGHQPPRKHGNIPL
ncbi:MAG: hypothetical protein L0G99_10445 [Propionibacteriales bacterium]|nr:hypothetical protein [Propionibacteriales bacterium]